MDLHSEADSLISSITNLSLHALRVELHRRSLSTAGLRHTLQRRLEQHLGRVLTERLPHKLRQPSFITVPHAFGSVHESLPYSIKRPVSSETDVFLLRTPNADPTLCTSKDNVKQLPVSSVEELDGAASNQTACRNDEGHTPGNPVKNEGFMEKAKHGEADTAALSIPSANDSAPSKSAVVIGVLQTRSVWVCGERNMRTLWRNTGTIGKANLSRSAPSYSTPEVDRLGGRALRQLLELEGDSPDTSRFDIEHLQLTLVEAYYAAFVLKKLLIHYRNNCGSSVLCPVSAWRLFCTRGGHTFAPTFVAYCRYRAAGWIPRSGLKYGADWVLYPSSMKRHTHSHFCVILRFNSTNEPCKLDRTWVGLQNRLRLTKNVAKTLVIAEIRYKSDNLTLDIRNAFKSVTITELTVDRWVP